MSTHKHFDKICCVVIVFTLIFSILFMNAGSFGVQQVSAGAGYENRLFDTSYVHNINIIMDDWEEFLSDCKNEEYYNCTLIIDNEAYKNVAIRGKGNTSLTQVSAYGNDRYSFKVEFDHYDSANTYHGLDKLCLNNIIQDNTYMKDYLTYQMMAKMDVASPLCSYVYITVNGEDWGLYLAVEGVEDAFLQRNYGNDHGNLYKPDSMNMGGGRGNGKGFEMDKFMEDFDPDNLPEDFKPDSIPENFEPDNLPEDFKPDDLPENFKPDNLPEDFQDHEQMRGNDMPGGGGMPGGGMSMGSQDVLLNYIDDDPDSYSNIFDNAKTKISDADKKRLIESLKSLSEDEDISGVVGIDRVIRYFVVHNFVLNFDSYTGSMIHNYYLYEQEGSLQMIPWDYNLAFGGFQSMDSATSLVNYPIDTPTSNSQERAMLDWIFENEEYTELYHQYFSEFIAEYFENGYFESMIDSVTEMIAPYVEKDPTKFCTYEEFEKGTATLREFCLLRAESIRGQLEGTIGSTDNTQNSEALIDAGELNIEDMGSMNNSMEHPMDNKGMGDKPMNSRNPNDRPMDDRNTDNRSMDDKSTKAAANK